MNEPIFSARIDQDGIHSIVLLYNRGGLAGQLFLFSTDVDEFLRRIVEPSLIDYKDRLPTGYQIDAQVAAKMTCPECGLIGLNYEPRFENRNYHAVAYCLKCGTENEF